MMVLGGFGDLDDDEIAAAAAPEPEPDLEPEPEPEQEPALTLTIEGAGPLGLNFGPDAGGSLRVAQLAPTGLAVGRGVREGMILLGVQGAPIAGQPREAVLDTIRAAARPLVLTFAEPRPQQQPAAASGPPEEISVTFHAEGPLGLKLDTSLCVVQLAADGMAAQQPTLSIGLVLRSVQGLAIPAGASRWTHEDAVAQIKAARRPLTLTFARSDAARSGERVVRCGCSGTRRIEPPAGAGLAVGGGAYTLYQLSVETERGRRFDVNKRFSDVEALHDAFIAPVLSRAFPFALEKRLSKNERQVVSARKEELPAYCAACLGLAGRLGSPAVDAAVQRFLRRSGGGYRWAEPPTLLEGTQEAATVWDVLGPWRQRVPHHTPEGQCDIKYEIVFESGPGGAAAQKLRFGANGHPATGSVMGSGRWYSADEGSRVVIVIDEVAKTDKAGQVTVGTAPERSVRAGSPPLSEGLDGGLYGPINAVTVEYRKECVWKEGQPTPVRMLVVEGCVVAGQRLNMGAYPAGLPLPLCEPSQYALPLAMWSAF